MSKVFGIGLSRTGTTSLSFALDALGFKAKHFPAITIEDGRLRILEEDLSSFDALCDTPVAAVFKELDAQYPGSKFIYTTRNIDQWLDSCRNYHRFAESFEISSPFRLLRMQLYGCEWFDGNKFMHAYRSHERDVLAHFAQRESQFLRLDICGGEGWEKLCRFLGRPVPEFPFPHKNQRAIGQA